MKLLLKKEHIYTSHLFLKFINSFIFTNLKIKIENIIYNSFFHWKKYFNIIPLFCLFESFLKIRPLLGFYFYVIKRKNIKKIKISPYFMSFEKRWKKAIYWIQRSIKKELGKNKLSSLIIYEFSNILLTENSYSSIQKLKHYKTLMIYKTSKNFIW